MASTPVTPTPTPTPATNAAGLAQLKADAQAWATMLVNELSTKLSTDLPAAQAALDAWIAKL